MLLKIKFKKINYIFLPKKYKIKFLIEKKIYIINLYQINININI